MDGKAIRKHYRTLKSKRSEYDDLLDNVRYWYKPSEGSFYSYENNTEGDNNNTHIFNDKGSLSAGKLANILYSSLAPVHEKFFQLESSGSEVSYDEKMFWREAGEKVAAVMADSNLAQSTVTLLESLVYYGGGVMYPSWNKKKGKMAYKSYYPADYYVDENYEGNVSVVVTVKRCNAYQLFKQYGNMVSNEVVSKANVPGAISKEKTLEILNYYIEEDEGWMLYIVEDKTGHVIDKYKYTSPPLMTPRWETNNYEVYGRGPCINALNTVFRLNQIQRTVITSAEKIVDPPIAIPYDSTTSMSSDLAFDTSPGGIVEFQPGPDGSSVLPQPISLGGDIKTGDYMIDKFEKMVDEYFFIDVLQVIMQISAQATATQINSANAEKLDIIIPLVVRLVDEFVKPVIIRTLQILVDEGEIGLPEGMEEFSEFDVVVNSSLILKLKQYKVATSVETVQILGALAGMGVSDNPLDKVDLDKLSTYIIESSNIPSDTLRTEIETKEFREAKAQAQQAAAQQESIKSMVKPIDTQKASEDGSMLQALGGDLVG